jgi:hypothetical protein
MQHCNQRNTKYDTISLPKIDSKAIVLLTRLEGLAR